MKKLFQSIRTHVPMEHRDAFVREISKENLLRLIIVSSLLIITETAILCFWESRILNTSKVVFAFILFNIVLLTVMYTIYQKVDEIRIPIIIIIQWVYLLGGLFFGLALAVIPQDEFASIHIYIIVVFAVAAFVYLKPVESCLMFFSVYLVLFILLPYYQTNTDILVILRINAFIMNVIAWVLSRMVFRMRIISFIDKKIILNKNQQLKDMTRRDSMTSLLNHEYVYKKLNDEIERAKRTEYPLSIMMIDIDDFKKVNDNYGHLTGDRIIIQVAQTLVNTSRVSDIIGRYGGEEFIIIMPETGLEEAAILAERIRAAIETAQFENGCSITVSVGIMEFHGESAEELIMGADKSHYEAKTNGKNRIVMFK